MKKEMKVVWSSILILISIIVVSAVLAHIKNQNLLINRIPNTSIVIIVFFSSVFSICFFYLLFSRLGTFHLTGEKTVTYILFVIGLSLFLSVILSYLGNSFL